MFYRLQSELSTVDANNWPVIPLLKLFLAKQFLGFGNIQLVKYRCFWFTQNENLWSWPKKYSFSELHCEVHFLPPKHKKVRLKCNGECNNLDKRTNCILTCGDRCKKLFYFGGVEAEAETMLCGAHEETFQVGG